MLSKLLFPVRYAKAELLVLVALLAGMALPSRANAQQLSFTSPAQMVDNDANQGSPTLIYRSGQAIMYYVNHSNNTIYADVNFSGNPTSTGIVVNAAELTDVGAALLGTNTILISYIPSNCYCAAFATSNNGTTFSAPVEPSSSALGLGTSTFDYAFVPALLNFGSTDYVATVGTNSSGTNLVYMSYTPDGVNFYPLHSSPAAVSNYGTVSRPSLASYNGTPFVAFTTGSSRQAVIGPATSEGLGTVLPGAYWGNSHRDSNYAGVSLVYWAPYLYVFGQDTASSQDLMYGWYNGSWGGGVELSPDVQMRWTPSLAGWSYLYLVYQDDANTNISYQSAP